MLSYVKTYKKAAWIALLLMGVELAVELVQPLVMSQIIDEGIQKGHLPTIWIWGGVLLGLTAIAFGAGIISSFYASDVSQSVGHDIRRDVFGKVQLFSETEVQTFSPSTLITRLTNDVTQIQGLIFAGLRIMLRAPLFIIGGIIMSFTINVGFALIFTAIIPILFFIMLWIMKRGVTLFQKVQRKLDRLNTIIQENLLGIRLVKAFHREKHETARFVGVNNSLMDVNKKALRIMELTMPVVMLTMNLGIVLILWIGSRQIQTGTVQLGDMVAILNYGTRMIASFGVFSFLLMSFTRGRASANRIADVLDHESTDVTETGEGMQHTINGDICFDNVMFKYPTARDASLKGISFSVRHGETIGILGETGSGKSTMAQLIPALYKPTSGELRIDDRPMDNYDVLNLRKQIGIVTQEIQLFSGSIKENIMWGSEEATMEEVVEAAKDACIHRFIMDLPDQYETTVGQRGVNLSGGQKQRLQIARVFVRNPKILVLDDSTSALDAHTERSVLQSIKNKQCTTLIISQKISSVIEADNILLFHQGKILAQGKHNTLLQSNIMYQNIHRSQMKEEVEPNGQSFE